MFQFVHHSTWTSCLRLSVKDQITLHALILLRFRRYVNFLLTYLHGQANTTDMTYVYRTLKDTTRLFVRLFRDVL